MLTQTQWIVLLAVAVVALIGIIALSARATRRRHTMLKDRFGPEYDRAVEEHGGVGRAERELAAREKRVHRQKLRPLAEPDRAQYSTQWSKVQARFVDDPSGSVQAADELIKSVMSARGYTSGEFDERVADLSVEHANVVQHYRAAAVLADANREGRANTEELRQAFVHYRELFADLLAKPTASESTLQEAHAHA